MKQVASMAAAMLSLALAGSILAAPMACRDAAAQSGCLPHAQKAHSCCGDQCACAVNPAPATDKETPPPALPAQGQQLNWIAWVIVTDFEAPVSLIGGATRQQTEFCSESSPPLFVLNSAFLL